MKITNVFAVALMLLAGCTASYADSAAFGVLSAFDLVAYGGVNVAPPGGDFTINGVQESDSNNDNNRILFNFEDASRVTIKSQYDAALLKPHATLSDDAQMGENFIVAAVGQTGEVHHDEYVDAIPEFIFRDDEPAPATTPEPGTLALMGSGILFMAALVHRQKRV